MARHRRLNSPNPDVQPIDDVIREHTLRAYELCGFRKERTADALGVSLKTI